VSRQGAVSFEDCRQGKDAWHPLYEWALGVCVLWCGVAVAATHSSKKLDSNVGLLNVRAGVLQFRRIVGEEGRHLRRTSVQWAA
jgi:hypothetical protein